MTTMNAEDHNANRYTPFWPLCLMALSLAIFLGWQLTAAVRQHSGLLRMQEQQTILAGQAAQAESKLQAMIVDLLTLAKTDADAKAIVLKYRINMNSPAQPALSLEAAASQPSPRTLPSGSVR